MAFTTPVTLLWMAAPSAFSTTAMTSPSCTSCFFLTTGWATAPKCMDKGSATWSGAGISSMARCSVSSLCFCGMYPAFAES